MSRTIAPGLAAHLTGDVTSLAVLWRIVRRDGVIFGFTSHDRDIAVDGVVYRAVPSFLPSAFVSTAAFEAGDIELSGMLSSSAVTEADLAAGRFDFARLTVSLMNWAMPGEGSIALATGTLGAVRWEDGAFRAELHTDSARFDQVVTENYSPECRADFGDRRCRVDLAKHRVLARVTGAAGRSEFSGTGVTGALVAAANWYAYGPLRWLTGGNAGVVGEVLSSAGGTVRLKEPMRGSIAVGDLFLLTAGCDRRFSTCTGKFGNGVNFRGEPHVPGLDAMLDYPDAR